MRTTSGRSRLSGLGRGLSPRGADPDRDGHAGAGRPGTIGPAHGGYNRRRPNAAQLGGDPVSAGPDHRGFLQIVLSRESAPGCRRRPTGMRPPA